MESFIPELSSSQTTTRTNFSKETISKIRRNIRNNNRKDKELVGLQGTFTYEQFIEKLEQQDYKCYVCQQEFKYDGEAWCYFFPSADRIDNKKNHNKDNVQISCFFCNVRAWKGISEKTCGLCHGLGHSYDGIIQTKSELFSKVGHSEYRFQRYIDSLNNNKKTLQI